ncbi:unnamed protein product [Brachionus calyciflorus]|uniref:Uncharacterized protein n=1 Tax=Brachionus calyciflorus TaxID=104777 RepID=A0A813W8L4_9BILA|nr:unnamed protein product [Brachionus calyciflorus]
MESNNKKVSVYDYQALLDNIPAITISEYNYEIAEATRNALNYVDEEIRLKSPKKVYRKTPAFPKKKNSNSQTKPSIQINSNEIAKKRVVIHRPPGNPGVKNTKKSQVKTPPPPPLLKKRDDIQIKTKTKSIYMAIPLKETKKVYIFKKPTRPIINHHHFQIDFEKHNVNQENSTNRKKIQFSLTVIDEDDDSFESKE